MQVILLIVSNDDFLGMFIAVISLSRVIWLLNLLQTLPLSLVSLQDTILKRIFTKNNIQWNLSITSESTSR